MKIALTENQNRWMFEAQKTELTQIFILNHLNLQENQLQNTSYNQVFTNTTPWGKDDFQNFRVLNQITFLCFNKINILVNDDSSFALLVQ